MPEVPHDRCRGTRAASARGGSRACIAGRGITRAVQPAARLQMAQRCSLYAVVVNPLIPGRVLVLGQGRRLRSHVHATCGCVSSTPRAHVDDPTKGFSPYCCLGAGLADRLRASVRARLGSAQVVPPKPRTLAGSL